MSNKTRTIPLQEVHVLCLFYRGLRMAEELGTSVIEEKGTRDTVTHAALMPLSLGLVRA